MPRLCVLLLLLCTVASAQAQDDGLWKMYEHHLKGAKYVDLTFAFSPTSPVWLGFDNASFGPAPAGRPIEG